MVSFEIIVVDPTSGVGVDTCSQPHKAHPMSLSRCVETRANLLQQPSQSQGQNKVQSPPARPIESAVSHQSGQLQLPPLGPWQAVAAGHQVPGAGHRVEISLYKPGPDPLPVPGLQADPIFQPFHGAPPVPGARPIPRPPTGGMAYQ